MPCTLPSLIGVADSSTTAATRGASRSSRPFTQKRPMTLGSIVVPEMSLPPRSITSTSMSPNGSGGTSARASSVSSISPGPPTSSASRALHGHDVTGGRLDRRDAAEQTAGAAQQGDALEDPVAHLDRSARVHLRRAGALAEADHRHLGESALDRSAVAGVGLHAVDREDAVGRGGVGVEVHDHPACRRAEHHGVHRRPDLRTHRLRQSPPGARASPAGHRRSLRRDCPSPGRRTARRRASAVR